MCFTKIQTQSKIEDTIVICVHNQLVSLDVENLVNTQQTDEGQSVDGLYGDPHQRSTPAVPGLPGQTRFVETVQFL